MRRRVRGIGAALLAALVVLAAGGCSPRASEWTTGEYVIAGGSTTGVYYEYGTHVAAEASDALGIRMQAAITAGSVDNLFRVDSGSALLGFAQGDAAADAVAGVGAFAHPMAVNAVARLYDEYVQIVVRDGSDIHSVSDLAGRDVSLGAPSSGVHLIAERLLDAVEVPLAEVRDRQLDLDDSVAAMAIGEIDAFFWVGGLPTPGISALAETMPVRLLPIPRRWVNEVNDRYSHAYRPADLPAGLYGLAEAQQTMAVPNYLVTSSSTSDAMVRDVLEVLFESRIRIAVDVPAAAFLDRRQAIFTGPVPLHPGAVGFYRDQRR